MVILDWYEITLQALADLWMGFIIFLPKLVGAIVVLVIGWIVAAVIGRIVSEVLRKIKFNQLFEKGSWKTALEKAEFKVDASGFIGAIFKWVLIIVFLLAAVEILGLETFSEFVKAVVLYLPNVIAAALILVVAVIISDLLEKIVRAGVEGAGVGYGRLAAAIVKWSIWVVAAFAILEQVGVAPQLVSTLLTGIVGLLVIAGGIAFGLGGKDTAGELLDNLRKRFKE